MVLLLKCSESLGHWNIQWMYGQVSANCCNSEAVSRQSESRRDSNLNRRPRGPLVHSAWKIQGLSTIHELKSVSKLKPLGIRSLDNEQHLMG